MRDVERQLLRCLTAYRLGRRPTELAELDETGWKEFYHLARIHKLDGAVCETLWDQPEFCGGNASLAGRWRREAVMGAAGQARRTERLLRLTQALERCGIPYVVVKGAVCRELYPQPDLRPSGDEDILIHEEDMARCSALMREEGFELVKTVEYPAETCWDERETGLHIELHTALVVRKWPGREALNQFFFQQFKSRTAVRVQNGTVMTLCPTAHFLFLVCHALHHFTSRGVGIRTLCDVVTYAERYAAEIDKETVYAWVEKVNGRIFLDQVLAAGRDYLEFSLDGGGWRLSEPPDAEMLLEDSLKGGVYGQSSLSRTHSAGLVSMAVSRGTPENNILSAVFPSPAHMAQGYPVLKRAPVLLPFCWAYRLGRYAAEVLRTRRAENSPLESMKIGKERTELMVKYGVIPKSHTKN